MAYENQNITVDGGFGPIAFIMLWFCTCSACDIERAVNLLPTECPTATVLEPGDETGDTGGATPEPETTS